MKIEKNGFTLIELMATLGIMAILTVILVPSILRMRDDVVNDAYENKKENIFTAAKDWAYDNLNDITIGGGCTTILVEKLIQDDYLPGDDDEKKVITDPRNGESMNKLEVCVTAEYRNVQDHYGNTKRIVVYDARFK